MKKLIFILIALSSISFNLYSASGPANDDCSGAISLGSLPDPNACNGSGTEGQGSTVSFNLNNTGSEAENPYLSISGCGQASPANDVWYSVTITGNSLDVDISASFASPNVAIYEGGCNGLVARGCAVGANNGNLSTTFDNVSVGETIYLQISSNNTTTDGTFSLSLANNNDCDVCIVSDNLTVSPAPINGTYQAGQTVSFCYRVDEYYQANTNWLHGIVPTNFGAGWNISTLSPSAVGNCDGSYEWVWATENFGGGYGTMTGWFVDYNPPGPGGGDGDFTNNYGDNCTNPSGGDWNFCFDITTDPAGSCVDGASLGFEIENYADGEIGNWTDIACQNDPSYFFNATLTCCQFPLFSSTPACPSTANGTATVTGQGASPWDYIWSGPSGYSSTTNNVAGSSIKNNLLPGVYTVTVTDNYGCQKITDVEVLQLSPMTLTATPTNPLCNGACNGSISIAISGGSPTFLYNWSNGQTTNPATNLCAGSYTVTVTSGIGCTATITTVLTNPPALTLSTSANSDNCGVCDGTATVTAVGNGTPNYSYNWSNSQNTNPATGLCAGTYQVTVTDSKGCTATGSRAVPLVGGSVTAGFTYNLNQCLIGNSFIFTNSGSSGGGINYSWNFGDAGTSTSQNPTHVYAAAGTYIVSQIVSDGTCADTSSLTITVYAHPTVTFTPTNVTCAGDCDGQIIAVPAGGNSPYGNYSWNNGGGTNATATGLCPNTYTLIFSDAMGCTANGSQAITDQTPIAISVSRIDLDCYNVCSGAASVSVTSGGVPSFSYSWDNGAGTSSNPTGLCAGTYSVTVTDSEGCIATGSTVVAQPLTPVTTSETMGLHANISCFGANDGSVTITASGGTEAGNYDFSIDGDPDQATGLFSGLTAGPHTITVTDDNGCTTTVIVNILEPVVISVTELLPSHVNVLCNGQITGAFTVQATGGTSPYGYSITGGPPFQASGVFNTLSAATYTVTVKDANNCQTSITITITEPPVLTSSIAPVVLTCNAVCNGSATVIPGGGSGSYTYDWDNTNNDNTQTTIADLCGNTLYTVIVADALAPACTVTQTVTPSEPTALSATIAPVILTCAAACNGSATVVAAGGSGSYNYQWDNPGGDPTATTANDLCGGITYNVTVEDAVDASCFIVESITPTEPTALTASIPAVNLLCNGDCNGVATVTANGGSGTYNYLWNNAAANTSATTSADLCGSTLYTVTVKDALDATCFITAGVTPVAPNALSISQIGPTTNVLCSGNSSGAFTVQAANGAIPYNYSIDGGITPQLSGAFSSLPAGSYFALVIDDNSCRDSIPITITQPLPLSASIAPVTLPCNGDVNGVATVTPGGGSGTYTYAWSNLNNTPTTTATLSVAGNPYSVTVADALALSCTVIQSVTVTEPAIIVVSVSADSATCGVPNGQITSTVTSGGSGPFQYTITGGAPYFPEATPTFTGLAASAYTVMVVDNNGCTKTAPVTVPNATAPVISLDGFNNALCNGSSDGDATISATGGTGTLSYQWYSGVAPGIILTDSTSTTIQGLTAGNYYAIVSDDNGCQDAVSVTISQPSALTAVGTLIQNSTCNGADDGSVTVNAAGGISPWTFQWYSGIFPGSIMVGSTNATISGLPADDYYAVVTDDNGCTFITPEVTVSEPSPLVVSGVVSTNYNGEDISCIGISDGAINLTVSGSTGSYSYVWSGPGSFSSALEDISGLVAGTYYVTASDFTNSACSDSTAIIVNEPTPITIATASTNSNCGQSDGSVSVSTVSGGTVAGDYTYNWENSASTIVGSTSAVLLLPADNYDLTVTDDNGCTVISSATISDQGGASVIVDSVIDISCSGGFDGSIYISISGGTSPIGFSWTGPSSYTNTIDEDPTGLVAGDYYYTVTDFVGCMNSGSITVGTPSILSASVALVQNVSCFSAMDGSVSVSSGGGTPTVSYQWYQGVSPGTIMVGSTNSVIAGLDQGSYYVIATDGNGCTVESSGISVSQPTVLDASAVISSDYNGEDISCNGGNDGSIDLTASGSSGIFTFIWSGTGSFSSVFEDITNLIAGTYFVTVSDQSNPACSDTTSIIVNEPDPISLSSAFVDAHCGNSDGSVSVTASNGTPGYSYNWYSDIALTLPISQSTNVANSLGQGTYYVLVTDANGCTGSISSGIGDLPGPTNALVTIDNNTTAFGLCDGGASATMTGAVSYIWYESDLSTPIGQTGASASGLCDTTYCVVITDSFGCTDSDCGTVLGPDALLINIIPGSTTCKDTCNGTAELTVSGGLAPYVFSWSGPGAFAASTEDLSGLCAGTYSVTVTDNNGLGISSDDSIVISEPTAVTVSITGSLDPDCFGGNNGYASALASGGTPGYTYLWSGGLSPTNALDTGLSVGTYFVLALDQNSCPGTNSVTISQPTAVTVSTSGIDENCNTGNGSVSGSAGGGTGPYTYIWYNDITLSNSIGNVDTVANLNQGIYYVVATDNNGCTASNNAIVGNIAAGTSSITSLSMVTCNGYCNGSATVSLSGGAGIPTYSWSTVPVQTSNIANGLCPGDYYVTITDANLCDVIDSVTITQPNPLTATFSVVDPKCFSNCDGVAAVIPVGGTTPYTYLWDTLMESNQWISSACAGDYTVTVTDSSGCTLVADTTLTEPSQIIITGTVTNANCGQSDGAIDITVTNGQSPFTYIWPNGATTQDVSGIMASTYCPTVTDANNCTATNCFNVNDDSAPTAVISSSTDVDCYGAANGSATVTASGGIPPYSYNWYNTQITQTAVGLSGGTYNVTVIDSVNCTVSLQAVIDEPSELLASVPIVGVTMPNCADSCNGSASVVIQGGMPPYSINWTSGSSVNLAQNLCDETYTVFITDGNGCDTSVSVTIVEPIPISLSSAKTDVVCFNQCNGTATVSATGGTSPYSFYWNDPNQQASQTATNLCDSTFIVTVVDANGCFEMTNSTIFEPTPLVIEDVISTNITCFGLGNGYAEVSVSGGTPQYSFSWSNSTTEQNVDSLGPGTTYLTVTDANSCTEITSVFIFEPPLLTLVLVPDSESCNSYCDGSIQAISTGGTAPLSYQWDINASFQTTNLASSLCPGTYCVTVTGVNGCSISSCGVVEGPQALIVTETSVTDANCSQNNGAASVGIGGGTLPLSIGWSSSAGVVVSSLNNATGLFAGPYNVVVSDANTCTSAIVINVGNIGGPVIDLLSSIGVDCFGNSTGSASVVVSNGVPPYSYLWSDQNAQTLTTANSLEAGTYTIIVTDSAGCVESDDVVVTQPQKLVSAFTNYDDANCYDECNAFAIITAANGTPGYSYLWSDNSGQTTQTASNLCAGSYYVVVTDANGCSLTNSITLTEPSDISITLTSISDVSCYGYSNGIVTINFTGGSPVLNATWSTGVSGNTAANLIANSPVVVIVTDAQGCTATETYSVNEPDQLFATYSTSATTCALNNGSAYITGTSGGTMPVSYLWSPGNYTTDSVVGLNSITYNLTVTDANQCTFLTSVPIDAIPLPDVSVFSNSDVSCYNSSDGMAKILGKFGTGGYTYHWIPDSGFAQELSVDTLQIFDLSPGMYTVYITDLNNCSDFSSFYVGEPNPIIVKVSGAATLCYNQYATLVASAQGGNSPYSYSWFDPVLTGNNALQQVSPDTTTIYSVQASDINGCTSSNTATVTITIHPPIISSILANDTTICAGDMVQVSAIGFGGNGGPYNYVWSTGTIDIPQIQATPDSTTTYSVTITDNCSKPIVESLEINVLPVPKLQIMGTPLNACPPMVVSFTNLYGSSFDDSYLWNFGDDDSSFTSTSYNPSHTYNYPGVYTVSLLIEGANECTSYQSMGNYITVYNPPQADFTSNYDVADAFHSTIEFYDQSSDAFHLTWDFGDESPYVFDEVSTSHTFSGSNQDTAVYAVTLTISSVEGCIDYVTKFVTIIPGYTFYVPTAFTPDFNGVGNNYFYPKATGVDADEYELYIYDRWGQVLFYTDKFFDEYKSGENLEGRWDGKHYKSGKPCELGVYTWYVLLKDLNGKEHKEAGSVTLIR